MVEECGIHYHVALSQRIAVIAGNRLIQNKENLSVVALLVDKNTSRIINAAKYYFTPPSTTIGIATISAKNPVDIYTLQGRKVRTEAKTLEGLPKGVYIVNGRKVVVK